MTDKLLPSEFWFFAINYAVPISNYLPVKTDTGNMTTPFDKAYGQKPDYRKLLPFLVLLTSNYTIQHKATLYPHKQSKPSSSATTASLMADYSIIPLQKTNGLQQLLCKHLASVRPTL